MKQLQIGLCQIIIQS